jgi:hypothetical protein
VALKHLGHLLRLHQSCAYGEASIDGHAPRYSQVRLAIIVLVGKEVVPRWLLGSNDPVDNLFSRLRGDYLERWMWRYGQRRENTTPPATPTRPSDRSVEAQRHPYGRSPSPLNLHRIRPPAPLVPPYAVARLATKRAAAEQTTSGARGFGFTVELRRAVGLESRPDVRLRVKIEFPAVSAFPTQVLGRQHLRRIEPPGKLSDPLDVGKSWAKKAAC